MRHNDVALHTIVSLGLWQLIRMFLIDPLSCSWTLLCKIRCCVNPHKHLIVMKQACQQQEGYCKCWQQCQLYHQQQQATKLITVLSVACRSVNAAICNFQRKTINHSLITGEFPGTLYSFSENGWITHEFFSQWVYKQFLCTSLSTDLWFYQWAQPLDKGCFGPLKTTWHNVCQEFCARNVRLFMVSYLFRYDFSL